MSSFLSAQRRPEGAGPGTGPAGDAIAGVPVLFDGVGQTFRTGGRVTRALERVDLEVEAGEFVAILGPSGCGKSTLMKIAAGLIAPSEGQVSIGGTVVRGPWTKLGVVFQSPVLLDWRNVLDNVLVQLELRGIDPAAYRDRAHALLRSVGLEGFADRMPRELSGGMRQRTAIVRGLIHDPPLLMMDEPFGALDALTREQMRIDLEKLWLSRRQTTLFITHGISEAVALADRVVVMTPRPGRIDRIIPIDLPRPRNKAVISSARFTATCDEITELFMKNGVIQY
ncbi:ABC transporter ATP-binding protein [uncultured Alsobacter sp.]|uniref:ABC transporter ATP-binding protein n=1 Tax=uncultured Alsobacter sp. TaxID=1748258 RepID=UPI0025E9559F|nr:ABC transporter ATP-binding protein [uncultured Alsobacter sp.]